MTEFVDPGTRSDSSLGGPASPGAVLRRARESAGLHIAALAVSLKVPVKKLEALEADRFDLLTDAVFVRALAGSVCRSLKLDPQSVLPLLPPSGLPRLDRSANDRITPSFRTPNFGTRTPWWTQVSRPAVLAGVAFVVGAALLFLLPKAQDKQDASVTTEVVTAASTAPPTPAPASVPASAPAPVVAVTPEAALPAPAVAAVPAVPLPPAATPVATTPALPSATQSVALAAKLAAPAAAPAAEPAAASANLITFTTTKTSWIDVTDARGTSVLRRQLAAGEVVGVSGVLPLKALVGRADGTQVQVRGQALDLAPLTNNNVARFEVK